ncbi:MAG: chemotaxis protein CheA [Deltaproteobacteria bacterium]|nr:chemotaxis protein CheA [Deltaproteobacteria bacterium]
MSGIDVSKYRALFIEESREHLSQLSRLLVALEKSTAPIPIIDEIFRHAHSIKGMAASMGYEPIVSLAHRVEDVVAGFRRDKRPMDKITVDLVLRGVDGLALQLGAVTEERPIPALDELVLEIGNTLADTAGPGDTKGGIAGATPTSRPAPADSRAPRPAPAGETPAGSEKLVRVTITAECPSPAARFFVVYRTLAALGKVLQSTPSIDEIRAARVTARSAAFHLLSEADAAVISARLSGLPEIQSAAVDADSRGSPPPSKRPPEVAARAPAEHGEAGKGSSTVRVRTDILDNLIDNVGDLFILRQRLENLVAADAPAELRAALDALSVRIREMRDQVMTVRMTPMRTLTDRYPRLVRDLARSLGKDVELKIEGDEIELDRAVLDNLDEPFVHTLRNAVDHGIEPESERVGRGKSKVAHIRIAASRDRDTVLVVIEDDGRGLDAAALRQRALDLGLLQPRQAEILTQRESLFLICLPGFSTKAEVSGVSGRGVGMDVVRAKIEGLGGTLDIESEPGVHTRLVFRLPLTVAIINVLLIEAVGRVFAVPVAKVVAVREMGSDTIHGAGGATYLSFRHALAPVVALREILHLGGSRRPDFAVVLEDGRDLVAVGVERVVGYREVVVKPLGDPLDRLEWFSGATILGDGQPILILDLPKAVRARLAA